MAALERGAMVRLHETDAIRPLLRGVYGRLVRLDGSDDDTCHLVLYPWGSGMGLQSPSFTMWTSHGNLDVLEPDAAARLEYKSTVSQEDDPTWVGAFTEAQRAWAAWDQFLRAVETPGNYRDPWLAESLEGELLGLNLDAETRRRAESLWHDLTHAFGMMNLIAIEQVGV